MPTRAERTATPPNHHGRGQDELQPIRPSRRKDLLQGLTGNHPGHGQHQHGQRQCQPDPKPASHIHQFGIGLFFHRDRSRLKRHATGRTSRGFLRHHVWTHRADIFGPRLGRRIVHGLRVLAAQIPLRITPKPFLTTRMTEIVRRPCMLVCSRGRERIHHHATHRVLGHGDTGHHEFAAFRF